MNAARATTAPPAKDATSKRRIQLAFVLTLGLSAALLFWIQPLTSKTLLPVAGGAPAVWHTVIVFFQAILLLGYLYAHALSTRCRLSLQPWIHMGFIGLALIFLPWTRADLAMGLDTSVPTTLPAQIWIGLLQSIGLPCLIVSSTSPLLQAWYARTLAPDSEDPYFLYVASNIGSLTALLAFPLLAESWLDLSHQFQGWSLGFIVCCLGIFISRQYVRPDTSPSTSGQPVANQAEANTSEGTPKTWFALAFLSSSLLLGNTTYLTTEVLNAPLIGILPLVLFLASYIVAFARRAKWLRSQAAGLTQLSLIAAVFQLLTNATDPIWMVLVIHLAFAFSGCLFIHTRLSDLRPTFHRLTEFYLWIAFGGVVAGIVHSFLCPILFNRIWEYPLALTVIGFLAVNSNAKHKQTQRPWLPITAALLALSLFSVVTLADTSTTLARLRNASQALAAVTVVALYLSTRQPRLFATTLALLFLLQSYRGEGHGKTLFTDRNFFGVSRVTLDPNGLTRRLTHGNTIHGRQFTDKAQSPLPLSYYHLSGPLNRIFKQFEADPDRSEIAVVGLGAGSMLYYGKAHQTWTVYEIDPLVIQLAQDPNYFTFLHNANVAHLQIKTGDARIQLQAAANERYDLIVLDAFSSDSIPTHLFTLEALQLYLAKLKPDGLLAFHISNRTLDLSPILSRLAAHLDLTALARNDPHELPHQGKDPSHWALLTRTPNPLTKLQKDDRWHPLEPHHHTPLWTDERSNILDALP